MRDIAAVLATFATWAAVAALAIAWPTPGALTAMATVAAIAVTCALTPHHSPSTRKDGAS